MCNALLIHLRCASLIRLLMWWNMCLIKSDRLPHNARVVYRAPSQRCPPGRTIKPHRYAASSIKTRRKSSAALQRKTDAWIEARPAISCLISQPPVPRCPCVCSTSLFYFSQALICFFVPSQCRFLFNSSRNERRSPETVTVTKTMNKSVPVLYVAHSE